MYKKLLDEVDVRAYQLEKDNVWLAEHLENHKKALADKEEGITWLEGQIMRKEAGCKPSVRRCVKKVLKKIVGRE